MSTRTLAVVSAGLSNPSSTRLLADRMTAAAVDALDERGISTTVEIVELRQHARDLADNLLTGFPNASLRAAVETVLGADALIAVTPIFAASYSGLFKTFFDVLDKDALPGKPVLLGATAGTARHSSPWSTHCGRCLATCAPSSCRPPSSPRPRTGPGMASGLYPSGSRGPRASWPAWSPAVRRPLR